MFEDSSSILVKICLNTPGIPGAGRPKEAQSFARDHFNPFFPPIRRAGDGQVSNYSRYSVAFAAFMFVDGGGLCSNRKAKAQTAPLGTGKKDSKSHKLLYSITLAHMSPPRPSRTKESMCFGIILSTEVGARTGKEAIFQLYCPYKILK